METEPNYVFLYDSSSCRVRSYLSFDIRDGAYLGISYGRMHAPNTDMYLEWNGKKQIAWHQFVAGYIGPFLDGIPVDDLAQIEMKKRYSYISKAEDLFRSSEESKKLNGVDWTLGFEATIWDYYGDQLFNLFDIRIPKNWEEYCRFMESLYNELKTNQKEKETLEKRPDWMPYPWQVC
jgi:hypothetical protein